MKTIITTVFFLLVSICIEAQVYQINKMRYYNNNSLDDIVTKPFNATIEINFEKKFVEMYYIDTQETMMYIIQDGEFGEPDEWEDFFFVKLSTGGLYMITKHENSIELYVITTNRDLQYHIFYLIKPN